MMLNVTEEQSINSAFNLTAQGIRAGIHLHSWLEKRKNETATKNDIETQKQETELRSDACSYYRGGHVENTNSTELQTLIQDLRGTEFTRADGNFVFLGDKSDLSYFWKKNEKNENVVLLRNYVDSIEDNSIKRGTLSALTQAKEKGFLTFDGNSYALTEKGKEAILDPGFIANRLKAEEVFFEKSWQGLKDNSQKFYVFTETNKEPTEYYLIGTIKGAEGNDFMKLISEDKQELILPGEAKGIIAFENKESGAEFVKENPDKIKDLQEYIKVYNMQKEKELFPTENYTNAYTETENGYIIALNNGDKLELPKEDVIKLENGNIKADIFYDKNYTLHIKDQKTTLNGEAVKEQLTKNATKTAETPITNTVTNIIDGTATAFPPAKAVTSTVNVVYKIAQGANTISNTVGSTSQKL